MRWIVLSVALFAGCYTLATRKSATRPVPADAKTQVWERAIATLLDRGYVLAMIDANAGLAKTETADKGMKPCGIMTCSSREMVTFTLVRGVARVDIRREFMLLSDGRAQWFEPQVKEAVAEVEADQSELLAAIVGSSTPAAP